jgi:hypothetical protein
LDTVELHLERKHHLKQHFFCRLSKNHADSEIVIFLGGCYMKKFVIAAIAALILSVASAEGFYVGALCGSTTIDTGVDTVVGATLDEDDSCYAFVIGNEIDENLSIEGFYIDFGEATLKGDSGDAFDFNGTVMYSLLVHQSKQRRQAWELQANFILI